MDIDVAIIHRCHHNPVRGFGIGKLVGTDQDQGNSPFFQGFFQTILGHFGMIGTNPALLNFRFKLLMHQLKHFLLVLRADSIQKKSPGAGNIELHIKAPSPGRKGQPPR